MLEQQRHIDLHLPTGWNQATTEELEHIAAAIIYAQQRQDRYHPFDWAQVKLMAVLAINGLTVSEEFFDKQSGKAERRVKSEEFAAANDETYMVKRQQDKEPWPITTGQLCDLCSHLDWIEDPKPRYPLFAFPYPELTIEIPEALRKDSGSRSDGGSKFFTLHSSLFTLQGPPPLLDGYTWQEYRWLTDWMQAYMQQTNAHRDATDARNEFLAVLFKGKNDNKDNRDNGSAEANSSLFTLHSSLFTAFDAVKWQVILFWWSALMLQLERKVPKVFKQQPVGKQRRQQKDTPWDFYNRVIATIQKYVGGLSEQDVNTASYGTILQQLDMMAREAEEMERLNKKYKK